MERGAEAAPKGRGRHHVQRSSSRGHGGGDRDRRQRRADDGVKEKARRERSREEAPAARAASPARRRSESRGDRRAQHPESRRQVYEEIDDRRRETRQPRAEVGREKSREKRLRAKEASPEEGRRVVDSRAGQRSTEQRKEKKGDRDERGMSRSRTPPASLACTYGPGRRHEGRGQRRVRRQFFVWPRVRKGEGHRPGWRLGPTSTQDGWRLSSCRPWRTE